MRPAGEVRQALRDAAPVLPQDAAEPTMGSSYLDLAHQLAGRGLLSVDAPAELRLVRQTVKNMVQAGELRRVGSAKQRGTRKALGLYAAPCTASTGGWDACATTRGDAGLAALQSAWWGHVA